MASFFFFTKYTHLCFDLGKQSNITKPCSKALWSLKIALWNLECYYLCFFLFVYTQSHTGIPQLQLQNESNTLHLIQLFKSEELFIVQPEWKCHQQRQNVTKNVRVRYCKRNIKKKSDCDYFERYCDMLYDSQLLEMISLASKNRKVVTVKFA